MHVPTPGTAPRYEGMATPEAPTLAVVLDFAAHAQGQPRWTGGTYINVLRCSDLHEIRDVLLSGHLGRDSSDNMVVEATDAALVAQVRAATSGTGQPMPEEIGQSSRWGTLVLIEWLDGGIAYCRTSFPHAYAPAGLSPVLPGTASDKDAGARASSSAKATGGIEVPYRVPPQKDVPTTFGEFRGAWSDAYAAGWLEGYRYAYVNNQAMNVDVRPFEKTADGATGDGYSTGLKDGCAAGLSDRAKAGTPVPAEDEPDWTEPDTDADGDATDGAMVPARTTGNDKVIRHGGVRFILREDGTAILDARDGSRVRIQSTTTGILLSSAAPGGGSIDIEIDGTEVRLGSVTAAHPLAKWPALWSWLSSLQAAYMAHTHGGAVPVPSLPGEIIGPPGDYGTTKVKGV